MVEPWRREGTSRRLVLAVSGACLGLWGLAGCSVAPKSRLDDCHRLSQTLQSENSRLKDDTLGLRSRNQDLTQRAVDDAGQLRTQGEAIRRLEKSVIAYQDERDQLSASFERVRHQLQSAVDPPPRALLDRLKGFAEARPGLGLAFDPESARLTIPSAPLFEPGTDRLKPEGRVLLRALSEILNDPEAREFGLLVAGRAEGAPIQRAGLAPSAPRPPRLGLDRAERVRDLLAAEGGIDAARIEVAGFEAPPAPDDAFVDDAASARGRRIEIRLRKRDPAETRLKTAP